MADAMPASPATLPFHYNERTALQWLTFFGLGFLCLGGRWQPGLWPGPALVTPGFALNASLALVFLPTFYYCLRVLFPGAQSACRAALGLGWVVFFFPIHWAGLTRYLQHGGEYPIQGPAEMKAQVWLTEALDKGLQVMPHEFLFMGALLLAGIALLGWGLKRWGLPGAGIRFWLALYAVLILSTWLHLSNRSPYTYLSLQQEPPQWFARCLGPEQQCLAEGDYFVFKTCEGLFRGEPVGVGATMVLHRPLTFFLSAPFSSFFNPWFVYLGLNVAAWFLACACLYAYARPKWGPEVARLAAILTAMAPGFITYASQPMNYVTGFAAVAISLGLFQKLFEHDGPAIPASRYIIFGGVLGLLLLTYDHFQFLGFFLALGLFRRLPFKPLALSLVLGLGIYAAFIGLTLLLPLPVDQSNTGFVTGTLIHVKDIILSGQLDQLITGFFGALGIFKRSLFYSFFTLAPLLALLGLLNLQRWRASVEALLLIAAVFASIAILHYGGIRFMFCEMAELPRFAFAAYPAIYVLAASGLVLLRERASRTLGSAGGHLLVLALLGAIFLSANVDVFGYPRLYYFVQFPSGGHFTEAITWWESLLH